MISNLKFNGKTKNQRETRDFSMALVIKTHQNNNKKHIIFFGNGLGPINLFILFWGGGAVLFFYFFLLLKKSFRGNEGGGGGHV
jgi:hypothetical protein